MSYNRLIPQPTDLISNSQAAILGNFEAIDSGTSGTGIGFSRNHVTMADGVNGGLHIRTDFFAAVSDPTVSGFVGSAYVKSIVQGGLAAADQLFFSNGTAYPLSGAIASTANGFMYLPGGILVKWGSFSSVSGAGTFSYPTGATIPVFATALHVFLQPVQNVTLPDFFGYIRSISTTGFNYSSTSRTSSGGTTGTFSYLAIGT